MNARTYTATSLNLYSTLFTSYHIVLQVPTLGAFKKIILSATVITSKECKVTVEAIIEIKFSEAKRLLRVDEMTVYTAAAIRQSATTLVHEAA